LKKSFYFFTLFSFCSFFNGVLAQNSLSSQDITTLTVSFNSKITTDLLRIHSADLFQWTIENDNQQTIASGSQDILSHFLFPHSGNYTLSIMILPNTNQEGCQHGGQTYKWNIVVSPIQVDYNIDSISFGQPLTSGAISNGLSANIPVVIQFENNHLQPFNLQSLKARFQGAGSMVTIENLSNQLVTTNGTYTLQLKISGTVRSQSYIMIDFVDHNGNVSTYYHTTEL
jgi:hypothetical protein